MKPDSPEPSDAQLHLLRQQLILAQARLLELEDARQSLLTKVAFLDRCLAELQTLANAKVAEREHFSQQAADLRLQLSGLSAQLEAATVRIREFETTAGQAAEAATAREARIRQLESELAATHASLTWRWTAPLRRLGRHPRHSP